MCCGHHNFLSVFPSQRERWSWKRVLKSEGIVQKKEFIWIRWRAFQVPANHLPHSLGEMQPIVNWTHIKAPESAARGGRGRLRTTGVTALEDASSRFCCSHSHRVQSYLCPLCEALISPNSCRLERSRPLTWVVRNCKSCEAASQTPWKQGCWYLCWKYLLSLIHAIQASSPWRVKVANKVCQQMKRSTGKTIWRHNQSLTVTPLF